MQHPPHCRKQINLISKVLCICKLFCHCKLFKPYSHCNLGNRQQTISKQITLKSCTVPYSGVMQHTNNMQSTICKYNYMQFNMQTHHRYHLTTNAIKTISATFTLNMQLQYKCKLEHKTKYLTFFLVTPCTNGNNRSLIQDPYHFYTM